MLLLGGKALKEMDDTVEDTCPENLQAQALK